MPVLTVNGKEVEFEQGMTVLQACELGGVEIPRFCYHERLEIAGNCRMCLVEIAGGPPKPAASCAMPAAPGMQVRTDSPMVKKAREGVMEFLLLNHPLDCPICDQGGECDLQDQAMEYGRAESRYGEEKRAVTEKYMGPLVKTFMTRCIHCTRCIRFMDDVAGVHELGAVARGENMQVTTYVEKSLSSELSGNIVDLCPVGALTSRPYAYKARPWELRKTESVDAMDGACAAIRIDSRGKEVMRVLPRLDEEVNEEWISDKTRHALDGLKVQRLDRAYVRRDGKLHPCSYDDAAQAAAEFLRTSAPPRVGIVAGPFADVETMFAATALADVLGTPNVDCRFDGTEEAPESGSAYRCHTLIAEFENADAVLLVGTNPRYEAPLLNLRIRRAWLRGGASVASVGEAFSANYPLTRLGASAGALRELGEGRGAFASALERAKRPVLLLGAQALAREDAREIENLCAKIAQRYGVVREDHNGFNVLHDNAARVGGLHVGMTPRLGGMSAFHMYRAAQNGAMDAIVLLGADDFLPSHVGQAKIVYVGHHGEAGAAKADVILPAASYMEKNAIYMNIEGRVRRTQRAVFAPGAAKEDWAAVEAIRARLADETPQDETAFYGALYAAYPELAHQDEIAPMRGGGLPAGRDGRASDAPFRLKIRDYYRTDVVSRHSAVMAQCSKAASETREREAA
jgi:NADH-quinone oxidoreductase subunit G